MRISELIERILEISHDEVAPDTNLKQKAMRWLNSAYHEILETCATFQQTRQKEISLALENGKAALPEDFSRILSVKDGLKGSVLTAEKYELTVENKTVFWNVKPETPQVVLKYLPIVEDLQESSAEAEIQLPKQFHSHLVWGALVWASVYERGFNNATDLNLFQNKWDEAKREVKLSLASSQVFRKTTKELF